MLKKYLSLKLIKVCIGVIELGEIIGWNYSTTNYGRGVSFCSDNTIFYN